MMLLKRLKKEKKRYYNNLSEFVEWDNKSISSNLLKTFPKGPGGVTIDHIPCFFASLLGDFFNFKNLTDGW